MTFHILHSPDHDIPLGDSMLLFQLKGERRFKPFFEIDDHIEAIYLPLASDRVLAGGASGQLLQVSDLPSVIAEYSLEYFISGTMSAKNEILHDRICTCADMLSHEQIAALIEEIKGS